MCRLARSRRHAVAAHVAEDHRTVADAHLRAVVLADLHPFCEAERR